MADGEGGKEAFCLLLWKSTGGGVTPDLKILRSFDQEGTDERFARGYCTRPWDCFTCPTMQDELAQHVPGTALWLCQTCVTDMVKAAEAAELAFSLPGHYCEGQCQRTACDRPSFTDDEGTHPPGFSRFLQLYIGPTDN